MWNIQQSHGKKDTLHISLEKKTFTHMNVLPNLLEKYNERLYNRLKHKCTQCQETTKNEKEICNNQHGSYLKECRNAHQYKINKKICPCSCHTFFKKEHDMTFTSKPLTIIYFYPTNSPMYTPKTARVQFSKEHFIKHE